MPEIFIYVTVPSQDEAQKIAEAVVTDRLAACANIIPGMKSVYRWEGKIQQSDEVIVIFKTIESLFTVVEARVKKLHSYKTPCIAALPVTNINAEFKAWVAAETKA
jgi:periplasmic divalent cation tolerance protein